MGDLKMLDDMMAANLKQLAADARQLPHADAVRLAGRLIYLATNAAFATGERRNEVFTNCEAFGTHVLPVHFYSPVPSSTDIAGASDAAFAGVSGVMPARDAVGDVLEMYARYAGELAGIPVERPEPLDFHWRNPAFCETDALGLYAMIRHLRPRRIVEVGSGFSTLLAVKALERNGCGEILCIDPNDNAMLAAVRTSPVAQRVLNQRVQDTDPREFGALGSGDILFIDGSHVSKYGSDVNFIMFNVLPSIAGGVTIHFHDIHLPADYPLTWVRDSKIFWNEQYLLAAFMAFNGDFEPVIAHQPLVRMFPSVMDRLSQLSGATQLGGGSYWLRRREAPLIADHAVRQ